MVLDASVPKQRAVAMNMTRNTVASRPASRQQQQQQSCKMLRTCVRLFVWVSEYGARCARQVYSHSQQIAANGRNPPPLFLHFPTTLRINTHARWEYFPRRSVASLLLLLLLQFPYNAKCEYERSPTCDVSSSLMPMLCSGRCNATPTNQIHRLG